MIIQDRPASIQSAVRSARGIYYWLAASTAIVALFGSLTPFDFRPPDAAPSVWSQFAPGVQSRTDFAGNIALTVPLGYALAALGLRRTTLPSWLIRAALLTLAMAGFSFALEFMQLFLPGRTAAISDVVAQVIGAVLGIATWQLAGRRLELWLYVRMGEPDLRTRCETFLWCYIAIVFLYALQPFDLLLAPADLARRVLRESSFLATEDWQQMDWWQVVAIFLAQALTFFPIGLLVHLSRPRLAWRIQLTIAAVCVLGTEFSQLFIRSRTCDLVQAFPAVVGAAIGLAAARPLRYVLQDAFVSAEPPPVLAVWLRHASRLFALCVVLNFSLPLRVDPSDWQAGLLSLVRPPFAGLQAESVPEAMDQLLNNVSWFVAFGVLCTLDGLIRRGSPGFLLPTAVSGLGLAVGVELLQTILPDRVPDSGDILLYLMGFGTGVLLARRIYAALIGWAYRATREPDAIITRDQNMTV